MHYHCRQNKLSSSDSTLQSMRFGLEIHGLGSVGSSLRLAKLVAHVTKSFQIGFQHYMPATWIQYDAGYFNLTSNEPVHHERIRMFRRRFSPTTPHAFGWIYFLYIEMVRFKDIKQLLVVILISSKCKIKAYRCDYVNPVTQDAISCLQ